MKSDNELIAEFHGWKPWKVGKGSGQTYWNFPEWGRSHFPSSSLKYDTSWDWLMPVVEKISFLYDEFFHKVGGNTAFINKILGGEEFHEDDHYMEVIALPVSSKISEVYKAVVAFIKWYNSQSENV